MATKAGLRKARLYDLRHTCACHLVMARVGLDTIKELLGHHKIKTAMLYAHLSSAHLDHTLTKLGFTPKKKLDSSK